MGLLTQADGTMATSPEVAAQLQAAGYVKCLTARSQRTGLRYGLPCQFYISPEGQAHITNQMGGYYTCPSCLQSHDLLHEMPWHGVDPREAEENENWDRNQLGYQAGGGTRIGLLMDEQAHIGEDLVSQMGELPGYGPIVWWHEGGATGNSPLDGATADWGIEVKTLGYDATHHRFVPGGRRPRGDGTFLDEKAEKNEQAASMGKQGVLGILVMLDYRRSVADIYAREFPLERGGVKSFRSNNSTHLVKEVPFHNPLMDPASPAPQVSGTSEFAKKEMPF